jgi:hypothetical protein
MASGISILIILPLAPFSLKLHRYLTILILLSFVASTIFNWLAFPFSQEAPLKVFFQQKLELDVGMNTYAGHSSHGKVIRAVTALTGVPEYIDTIVTHLPSSWGMETSCGIPQLSSGLVTCTWEGGLLPAPGSTVNEDIQVPPANRSADWLVVNAMRTSPTSAQISVKGTNTRSCRLYFDSSSITSYRVQGSSEGLQGGHEIPEDGVPGILLWSRTWDREFVVDVEWSSEGTQEGRISCEWNEYQSATAGIGGSGGNIPAFEEVLAFLPEWVVVSKADDGLVEAWGAFSV